MVDESVVEGERACALGQDAAAPHGVLNLTHGADGVVLGEVIELPLEGLDAQAFEAGIAAVRQVAYVMVHHDGERAHRVSAAMNEELHARLAGSVSSAS